MTARSSTVSSPAASSDSLPTSPLGSMATLWECRVRYPGRTPPMDAHVPLRLRADSERHAVAILAHYYPELEVLQIERA